MTPYPLCCPDTNISFLSNIDAEQELCKGGCVQAIYWALSNQGEGLSHYEPGIWDRTNACEV